MTAIAAPRRRQRALDAPAEDAQSVHERRDWKADYGRPLADVQRSSSERNRMIVRSVILLLTLRSPAAVARAVADAAILALYRVRLAWRLAHVSEKVFKTLSPALAYSNPTRPIFIVRTGPRIMAALNHVHPSSMNMRLAHTVRRVSLHTNLPFLVPVKAPAGTGRSIRQRLSCGYVLGTA